MLDIAGAIEREVFIIASTVERGAFIGVIVGTIKREVFVIANSIKRGIYTRYS